MTLYQRGNIYWVYVSIKGVRHARSTGTSNRKLAEQIGRQFQDELTLKLHQLPQLNPEMRFAELFAHFIANAGPKPWHLDRGAVLLTFFENTPIGRINKSSAREYRLFRHRQKKLTDTTINRDLECLRHLMFWAVDEGFLATNPLSRLPMVRERRKRRSVMSVEEELLLLPVCAPHLRPIVTAALATGMRRGEILSQRWEDVDFARRLLFVTHSKTPEGESREIPLTNQLFNLLWESRENEGLIFTFKGNPVHRIKTAWRAAIRRSGIRYYRFHDLRHTFNTRLMEAGVIQEVRKALIEHSSGEDVHSMYTHVELPMKRDAIRKLEIWMESHVQQLQQEGGKSECSNQPEARGSV